MAAAWAVAGRAKAHATARITPVFARIVITVPPLQVA
jgi:hypothetical protein